MLSLESSFPLLLALVILVSFVLSYSSEVYSV
jgi:hypothetical protein